MRTYWLETKSEFLSLWRNPRFVIPTLSLPPLFYLFFGVLMSRGHQTKSMALAVLVGYSVFGALTAAMYGLAVSLAHERGLGWLEVKRASPMPMASYFTAKIASAMAFALIVQLMLSVMAATLSHVQLPAGQWLGLTVATLGAAIPFCALGLLVGTLTAASATPAVANLIAMPMAICSGLWIPIDFLPAVVRKVAVFLPAYHAAQIGRTIVGRPGDWPIPAHAACLAVFTAVLIGLTVLSWRRSAERANG